MNTGAVLNSAPLFLDLLRAENPGRVAVPFLRFRHQAESVIRVPGRACADDPAALVDDIEQLLIDQLGALALGFALPVFDIDDIVREYPVEVLAGQRTANTHGQQLRGPAPVRGQVRPDLKRIVRGQPKRRVINAAHKVHHLRG